MRLFAHHDVDGKIRSLTWFNAPEGVSIMLTPAPGELVSEIEGHKLTGTVPSEKALRSPRTIGLQSPGPPHVKKEETLGFSAWR
jgi:hypothetical protein